MSTPPVPPLKSIPRTPTRPDAARPGTLPSAVGEPKGAARKGVVSALRPDPHPTSDPTPDRPGIRIYAPPVYRHPKDGARWSKRPGDTPTAAWACACGESRTARGLHAVTALIAAYDTHKHACTGTPAPHTESRTAA